MLQLSLVRAFHCLLIMSLVASKSTHTVTTRGENINIRWSPNGNTIAVGNKEDLLTFVDARTFKIINEEQFKYEVSVANNKT